MECEPLLQLVVVVRAVRDTFVMCREESGRFLLARITGPALAYWFWLA